MPNTPIVMMLALVGGSLASAATTAVLVHQSLTTGIEAPAIPQSAAKKARKAKAHTATMRTMQCDTTQCPAHMCDEATAHN